MCEKNFETWKSSELNEVAEALKRNSDDMRFNTFLTLWPSEEYPYNGPLYRIVRNWYRRQMECGGWLSFISSGFSEEDVMSEVSIFFLERGFSDWKADVKFTAWFCGTLRQHGLIGRRFMDRWQRVKRPDRIVEVFSIEAMEERDTENGEGRSFLDRYLAAEENEDISLPLNYREMGKPFGLTAGEVFILISSYDFEKEGKTRSALKKYLDRVIPEEMRNIKTAKKLEKLIQYLKDKARK